MFKILRTSLKPSVLKQLAPKSNNSYRTFLSQAYYCNEIWEDRLSSPFLQKVNLDLLYHELDQRFQKTRRISPVDVDIFVNSIKNNVFVDEMLDVVHKLRLSQDTGNMLTSTVHAVIRTMMNYGDMKELLQVVDDRLNYGLFLDDYTANILMDTFWKNKDFVGGSIIASQIMLQEDFKHPLTINLALLHCYNYLLTLGEWPQPPQPEEPEEEVKVRVKYLRNAYDDEHFDLRDPQKIVGKTLAMAAKNRKDSIHHSLRILGLVLFGKEDLAKKVLNENKLVKEIMELLPEASELRKDLDESQMVSEDVQIFLQKQVTESVGMTSEKDIAKQCEVFKQWESERLQALEEQKKRLLTAERLAEIDKLKQHLKEKEQKLWFFENEENIELAIEEGEDLISATQNRSATKTEKTEENYIPPEVNKRY